MSFTDDANLIPKLEEEKVNTKEEEQTESLSDGHTDSEERQRREVHWFSALWQMHLHIFALYGLFLVFTQAKIGTIMYTAFLTSLGLLGLTAGAHRLWAHRSYQASLPLRIFLMICQTLSLTGPIYDWVLTHRIHHRFHGTHNDPFNHNRGFLYAHINSRFLSRSSNWDQLAREVDMSDMDNEQLITFQRSFYWILAPIVVYVLSIAVPVDLWNEDIVVAAMVVTALRTTILTHINWLICSSILVWGLRKDKNFSRESDLIFLVTLSFWPHYHYLLPWDYQTGEFGTYGTGFTTSLIRAWVALGWASGLRSVETWGIRRAMERAVSENKDVVHTIEDESRVFTEKLDTEHLVARHVHAF